MVCTGFARKVSIIIITMSIVLIIIFLGLRFNDSSAITGFSVINCKYVADGIECKGELYTLKSLNFCTGGGIPVCTNICELDRLTTGDSRVCPEYCIDYCLPEEVAEKLNN